MEQHEEDRRWHTAQEFSQAAEIAWQHDYYQACVGLAYYACFQAMWLALGDPPLGTWNHGGITRRFCHGQWTVPPFSPTQMAELHRSLLDLYELRLDAHYRAQSISQQQAYQSLQTVSAVLQLVQRHKRMQPEESL